MTATNMCSNFGGFRCLPPLIKINDWRYLSHKIINKCVLMGIHVLKSIISEINEVETLCSDC